MLNARLSMIYRSHGVSVSNYVVTFGPVPHTFTPSNLAFGSGSLDMKVSAYSGSGAVLSSEIVTDDLFKYASVRTVLKSSGVGGVVEGNFFYLNGNQETDWEILTSTTSQSSADVPAGIWATNQASWTIDATTFYIDGVQKARLTSNVPTEAGHWIWNVWSNGDPAWSNGPPTADSITHIRSIDIYKGYTSTRSGTQCNI
ncbi:hypothetical protein H0H87_001232 [Tephrocybe sp. NHM501043]|nr:hypothetical protein H0H87_001232 [Tephrocybe sp. NHM501043]